MTQPALFNDVFRSYENGVPEGKKEESVSSHRFKAYKDEEEIDTADQKEDGPKKVSEFRTALPQVLASSAKNLVLLDIGMTIGYSTIVIPELLKATEGLSFTEEQASWFGSILFICQPVGSVVSGFLFEPLGRKRALILVNFPHILGWLLTYFATSLTQLFVAAVIMGIGIGFMEAPLITYVGEIAQAKWRGTLIAYAEVFVSIGFSVIYFIGTLTDWRTAAAISSAIPILAALAITQVPESPIWLISKGRLKDAEKSLCWLRGWVKPELVQQEFQELVRHNQTSYESKKQEIKISVISEQGTTRTVLGGSNNSKGFNCSYIFEKTIRFFGLKDLFRRQTVQPLLLVLVFFLFHHLGGVSGTRPYMVTIFEDFGTPVDANWASVINSAIGIIANILSFLVIKKIGKRLLSHISFIGCAITNLLICIYGFFFVGSKATWFPVTSYFALNFLWTFGIGQTPWLLVSEIFPFRGRGLASGVSAAVAYLLGFLVTKTYYDLRDGLTVAGTFGFYGVAMIIGSILFYFYVPETEGKSLEEVERIFDEKFNLSRSRLKNNNTETISSPEQKRYGLINTYNKIPETRAHKNHLEAMISFSGQYSICQRQTLHPLLAVIILFVFHHLAGLTGTHPFMVEIFTQFRSPIDAYLTAVIETILGVTANIIGFCVIRKIGKRMIGHISFIGGAICNILIFIYGILFAESIASWIPATLYYILNFLWSFGLGLIPYLLISEVFPPQGKGLASGIAAAAAYLIGFFVIKTQYSLVSALTLPGSFGLYGIISIIGWIFFYFYIPETEGKSLEETQELFSKIFCKYQNQRKSIKSMIFESTFT